MTKSLTIIVSVCNVLVRTDKEEIAGKVRTLFDGKVNILLTGATVLVTGDSKSTESTARAAASSWRSSRASAQQCTPAPNDTELSIYQEEWMTKSLTIIVSVCNVLVRTDKEEIAGKVRTLFDGKVNILVKSTARAAASSWRSSRASAQQCTPAPNDTELSIYQEEWMTKSLTIIVSVCNVLVRTDKEEIAGKVRTLFDGKVNILVSP
uniref:Uncharacterized protein n=1 Tax=Oryza barthii TaxID=65489 RepID=A0A0D3GWW4_9ORYZ